MSNRLARLPLPTVATLPAWFAAHGPTLLAGVLVLVIAAQLAGLAWRLLAPAPPPAVVSGVPVGPAAPPLDLGAIVNAHLFGSSAPAASSGDAPATSLNLVLAGTMAGRDPDQGWAIIGDTPQTAKVYATGAALPGGARLLSVYADRVILERGGLRESLLLPRLSGAGRGPMPTAYTPPAVDNGNASLADSVRRLVAQDPAAASELLRPQPVFAGGQQRGYRVYPGRDRQRFAKTGLQPGDLVTEVNGVPLTDPERGLESLRGIDGGGTVNLTVERNGQPQQLTITPSTLMPATQAPIQNTAPPVAGSPPAAPPENTQ